MTGRGPLDWWARWPDLYDGEVAAFGRHHATIVETSRRNGLALLKVDWPANGAVHRLHVGYSPLHPFFRPEVAAPGMSLARHQNPFSSTLCLLTSDDGVWTGRERVADLIAAQLPNIDAAIAARAGGDWNAAASIEEQAPDPLTSYFVDAAEKQSAIFFSGSQPIPAAGHGRIVVLCQNQPISETPQPFEGVLSRVLPSQGPWLTPPFDLPQRLGTPSSVTGRWVRLLAPLPNDPAALLAMADAEIERLAGPSNETTHDLEALARQPFAITGILVEEEIGYGPQRTGDGWLFLATRASGGRRKTTLVAAQRVSDDMFSRLPIAGALRGRTAVVVGCGAIGGPVVIELARAGFGKVAFLDFDRVEPGNTVRWPLGRAVWGRTKVSALQEFLVRNYPYTTAVAIDGRLGSATTDWRTATETRRNPLTELRQTIIDADVVVDASASTECQHALAFLARELRRPFVTGYATQGVAGGVVARFPVGSAACLVCLHEHWADGSVEKPEADATGTVLPIGCNAPTFTGGAFDLNEVSLEIARSAIGLAAPDAYDAGDWQLSTLTLRKAGRRVLPRWDAGALPHHQRCGCVPPP